MYDLRASQWLRNALLYGDCFWRARNVKNGIAIGFELEAHISDKWMSSKKRKL